MKPLFFGLFCLLSTMGWGQNDPEAVAAIKQVMQQQEEAWSQHDIDGFMAGYWQSDSLKFFGSNGVTTGWQNTLDNYKKSYPKPQDTGILSFTFEDISAINPEAYWVMGRYHLARDQGEAEGTFMIIFKKIKGEWRIVADMSCG